jgi:hypothetical protein
LRFFFFSVEKREEEEEEKKKKKNRKDKTSLLQVLSKVTLVSHRHAHEPHTPQRHNATTPHARAGF